MNKAMTKLLSSILIIALLCVGCATTNNDNPDTKKADKEKSVAVANEKSEPADTVVLSDELFIGYGVDIEGLSPYKSFGTKHAALSLVYETLVTSDNGKIKPNLAESWEISDDGKVYTFKLREGIQFTDGTPFNAEAVKQNIELTSNSIFSWLGVVANYESVEAVDEYTVKFTMTSPFYATLNDFATYALGMISPKNIINLEEAFVEGTVGTGPYIYSDYEANQYYTFVRNENYWGEKPHYKKITLKIIPDENSRILALKSGEVDMILGTDFLSYDGVNDIKNDTGLTVKVSDRLTRTRCLYLNTTTNKLGDVNVRKAIAHAINKDEITDALLSGYEVSADALFNKALPYCDVDVNPYDYNVEKANQLLDDAGWTKVDGSDYRQKDGEELTLRITYRTDVAFSKEIADALKGYFMAIGVNSEVYGSEMMTWFAESMEGKFDITINYTYGIAYDPHHFISPMLGGYPESVPVNGLPMKSEIIKSINTIRSSNDEDAIAKAYENVLLTLNNEAAILPLSYREEIVVFNNKAINDYVFAEYPHLITINNVK